MNWSCEAIARGHSICIVHTLKQFEYLITFINLYVLQIIWHSSLSMLNKLSLLLGHTANSQTFLAIYKLIQGNCHIALTSSSKHSWSFQHGQTTSEILLRTWIWQGSYGSFYTYFSSILSMSSLHKSFFLNKSL